MKIARFSHDGVIAFGIVDDDELVVLGNDPMFTGFEPSGERIPLAEVKLLAPVIPRSKVVALRGEQSPDAPNEPFFVLKANTTVVGPGDPIMLPAQSQDVRVVGALGIVIGRVVKNVSVDDAAAMVFGYTVAADVTAHDLGQRPEQWSRAAGFDSFCPLGPVIETEFDPATTLVHGRINGDAFQDGDRSANRHTVAQIVAFASSVFTLLPGDVILTGAAVDSERGGIVDADAVEIEIPGIGTLSNPVRRAG